jgi:hypothetical protein
MRHLPARASESGLVSTPALEGRNLNSLGFQPQVSWPRRIQTPEGWPAASKSATLPGFGSCAAPHLGLKPQAIQISPLRGELGEEVRS